MGTKFLIWQQKSPAASRNEKLIELQGKFVHGSWDDRIVIHGFYVLPDKDGHFCNAQEYNEDELDAIQTFAVSRYMLDYYQKKLKRQLSWTWETGGIPKRPLTIYIRKNGINTRYNRKGRCIELDYFGPRENRTYYCRSVDIIAHEIAHAILDTMKPEWQNSDIETRGLAEAFCDLAAMFYTLSQKDLCEDIMRATNGDLTMQNSLASFGCGFSDHSSYNQAIRSAQNSLIYDSNREFTYDYSQVLVGGLYDVLIDLLHQQEINMPAGEALYDISINWQNAIMLAFENCGSAHTSLSEFADALLATNLVEKKVLLKHFRKRKIIPGARIG